MTFGRIAKALRFVMLLLALASLTARAAPDAERRVALVIGVSAYQHISPLSNPVNDGRAVAQALQRLNFDVVELYDPNLGQLNNGVRDFGIRAAAADVAVVYYAGHGTQVSRENFLIPADAKLESENDLQYVAMPLERLLNEVARASRVGIVLLDSCRNSPFHQQAAPSTVVAGRTTAISPGMARIDNVPRNTLVLMAAKADQIAEDGGEHSPFAAALLAHFQIPGLELGLFSRSVRDTVLRGTSNRQEPYMFSSLGADPFYFHPRPANRPPVIGAIKSLEVTQSSSPVALGIPEPTDPDGDPLTIRIVGLPRSGDVLVDGRPVTLNTVVSSERFNAALFKSDGISTGAVGTLDILVEDGRGGTVIASLPIAVQATQPAASTAGAQASSPPAPARVPAPVPANSPPANDVAAAQRPIVEFNQQHAADVSGREPAQRLEVDAWVDRADQTYRLGQPVTVSVRPHADGYITILNYGTSGRMTVIFPNQFQQDNRVRAGQTVQVPPAEAPFRLIPSGPPGVELLQVIATDHPLSLPEVDRFGIQRNEIPFVSFGRPAEAVAHDLVLQLDQQSSASSNLRIPVSKVLQLRVDQPVPVQPALNAAAPALAADPPLIVRTDKNVYRTGEPVQVTVIARQPCALTLLTVGPSGAIRQLFPNALQPPTTLMPGQILLVPPLNSGLRVVASAPAGVETMIGVCSRAGASSETALQQLLMQQNVQASPRDLALAAARPDAVEGQGAAAYFVMQ